MELFFNERVPAGDATHISIHAFTLFQRSTGGGNEIRNAGKDREHGSNPRIKTWLCKGFMRKDFIRIQTVCFAECKQKKKKQK